MSCSQIGSNIDTPNANCQKPKIKGFFFPLKKKKLNCHSRLSSKSKVAVLSSSWTPFKSICFRSLFREKKRKKKKRLTMFHVEIEIDIRPKNIGQEADVMNNCSTTRLSL